MTLKLSVPKIAWIHLLSCIICISWLNNGLFAQFGLLNFLAFAGCFGFWFLLTLTDRHFIGRYLKDNVWWLVYAAMVFLSAIMLDSFWNKYSYTAFYVAIMLMFSTYYKDESRAEERKILWFYYLAEITLIAIRTIVECISNPQYARILASGAELDNGQSAFFAASFDNVYAFTLVVVFIIAAFLKLEKKKIMLAVAAVLAVCIYFANFGTAIMVSTVFVILMLTVRKPKAIALIGIAVVFFFSVLKQPLADAATWLSMQEGLTDFLRGKFQDVANGLNGVTVGQQANTFYMRLKYTVDALEIFKNHPVFGIYGVQKLYATERILLRDHNVWFDMLAYFGVIRIIPFLLFWNSWYKNNKSVFQKMSNSPLSYVLLLWIILGFFNPVNKSGVQIFMVVMLPLSDILLKSENGEQPNSTISQRRFLWKKS